MDGCTEVHESTNGICEGMTNNDKQLIDYNLRFNNTMLKNWELEPVCSALNYQEFPLLYCMSFLILPTQDVTWVSHFHTVPPAMKWSDMGSINHPRTKQRHFFAVSAPVLSRDTCCFTASPRPRCRNCPVCSTFSLKAGKTQQKW